MRMETGINDRAMDMQQDGVSNPADAGLYHWLHRALFNCRPRWLLPPLLDITFALEGFYANKVRPRIGLPYSEKYLAYCWVSGSPYLFSGKQVLDIGCGDILFPSKLASLGHQSYAVDLLSSGIIAARDARVHFVRSDVCQMPFDSGQFDVVTAISTLEHIDPERMPTAVSEIGRVMKKDSTLFVTMPDCPGADRMNQLLTDSFEALSRKHRMMSSRGAFNATGGQAEDSASRQEGAGVTFLTLAPGRGSAVGAYHSGS